MSKANKDGHVNADDILIGHAVTGVTSGFTAGAGTAMNSASTSTGGTGTTAFTFGDVVAALKKIGVLAQ